MIKEIKYNGHSASPSDYQSLDGDMACMLNCIPERGALKPILPPETVESFVDKRVLVIHKISDFEVYILDDDDEDILYWRKVDNENGKYTLLYDFTDTGVKSVTPIGNTLAVLDGNGTMHYFLWRNDTYSNLGTQLPELEASATLNSYVFDKKRLKRVFEEQGLDFTDDADALLLTEPDTEDGVDTDDYKGGWLLMKKMSEFHNNTKTFRSFNDGSYHDARENVYNRIFSVLNKCKAVLNSNGLFSEPFFIRFAYRLYDGTHCSHTQPLLLCPNSWGQPVVALDIQQNGTTYFEPHIIASDLLASISQNLNLELWSDVITHVDVFVTPPLINYTDSAESLVGISKLPFYEYNDQNGWVLQDTGQPQIMASRNWKKFTDATKAKYNEIYFPGNKLIDLRSFTDEFLGFGDEVVELVLIIKDETVSITDEVGNIVDTSKYISIPTKGSLKIRASKDFVGEIKVGGIEDIDFSCHHYIELERTDGKTYKDVVVEYNNFFKIAELDTSELVKGNGFFGNLHIAKTTLRNLATLPTLANTNQQTNIASGVFSYNNRLNIIIQGENLPPCAALTAQNPTRGDMSNYTIEIAYVKVVENSQTSYKRVKDEMTQVGDLKLVYFSYPRATATELQIYYTDNLGQPYVRTIQLTRHPFLNLAYAFNMFDAIEGNFTECGAIPNYPQTPILYGNKIKTSDVNNPFIFSEENTSELPVGEIYALSTAAKALSQGQFGQFPLYAFTDKGVWALEVTGTGTYSARQPITRDVVLYPESVTQIDDAVLFATQRGIMLLSGSQVQCISEVLDGKAFDWEQYGFAYNKTGELGLPIFVIPWEQYKANIQMLYDYTGQRIIMFNPQYVHAYVFSLESKQWGIMESNIQSTVDYYPRAYAMTGAGDLVDYSATDKDFAEGYYITRPLKLDAPDVHKTITGIIQRGQFKKGHVNTMLYGSRDLDKWYPIYGSNDHILRGMRGTPYKYFRIASTFCLDKDESITGCSIDFEPRLNNKLR
jgi:hypothetical protein